MRVRLGSVKPHSIPCDRCDIGGPTFYARHAYSEEGRSTTEVRWLLCDLCLIRDLAAWDQRGSFAPEASPPPKPVRPPATTLAGYHQWALGYASSGGRWTGISSDRTSDMEAREA